MTCASYLLSICLRQSHAKSPLQSGKGVSYEVSNLLTGAALK
jgi:hypothetical protein